MRRDFKAECDCAAGPPGLDFVPGANCHGALASPFVTLDQPGQAATWIAADASDRANLLGAANVAAERVERTVTVVVEGADGLDRAPVPGQDIVVLRVRQAAAS